MQTNATYTKEQNKARLRLFFRRPGSQRIFIQGNSMEDALRHLRRLCPTGRLNDLWEVRA